MSRLNWFFLLIALSFALVGPGHTAAQDSVIVVRQSEEYTFGEALRFRLAARAPAGFTSARLTLLVEGLPTIVETPEVSSQDVLMLDYEVSVQEKNIPPFSEIAYQWELSTEDGDVLNTEPRTFRYKDDRVAWTWETEQRGPVIVHWNGEDSTVAQRALDVGQESMTRINNQIGTAGPQEDIHIYVYPERDPLAAALRRHNRSVQDWVYALAMPENSVILLVAASGPDLLVDMNRDLPHELTHIMVYRAAGRGSSQVPAWFNEGLAILSSAEPDATLRVTLQNAVTDGTLLPLESLCVESFATLDPDAAPLAYAQSESVMRYVMDRFGNAGVRELMDAYADGLSCGGAVERAIGLTLDDLDRAWRADLQRRGLRGSTQEVTPWLLLWGMSLLVSLLFVVQPPPRSRPEFEEEK